MKLPNWSTVCITLLHVCVPNSVQYMKTRHHIKAPQRDAVKRKHRKNYGKTYFCFFNRSFFTQKFVDSNAWTTQFSCFKEDKRIQDNCETVQHERTVFLSRQKLQKLSKRKNIDTNLTNQNRYINIPLAWIWFVYSFISFAFCCKHREGSGAFRRYHGSWQLRLMLILALCFPTRAIEKEHHRSRGSGERGSKFSWGTSDVRAASQINEQKRRTTGKTRRVKNRRAKNGRVKE